MYYYNSSNVLHPEKLAISFHIKFIKNINIKKKMGRNKINIQYIKDDRIRNVKDLFKY